MASVAPTHQACPPQPAFRLGVDHRQPLVEEGTATRNEALRIGIDRDRQDENANSKSPRSGFSSSTRKPRTKPSAFGLGPSSCDKALGWRSKAFCLIPIPRHDRERAGCSQDRGSKPELQALFAARIRREGLLHRRRQARGYPL